VQLPRKLSLPFFAYGLFRPGELGFARLKPLTVSATPASAKGSLLVRNGLPIADPRGNGIVKGFLLEFDAKSAREAYGRICEIEPDREYRWDEVNTGEVLANVLWGRAPEKGAVTLDANEWSGEDDPLFTTALDIVAETLRDNSKFEWDLRPLFRLEMAYLLLWSSIERYVSLRYHLGDDVWQKVKNLADEAAFGTGLRTHVPDTASRFIFRADKPEEKVRLDPQNPKHSLEYYYQIRSNLTHRGKGVVKDHDRLRDSLRELLAIFRAVLKQAFADSQGSVP
jgi:hypothetical protein